MTAEEAVATIAAAWRADFPPATVKAYVAGIADLDPDHLGRAVTLAVRSCRFAPTVSDLRTIVATMRLDAPVAAEALGSVEAAVASGTTKKLHPLARRTLNVLGGSWAWKTTDNPGVMRGQFLRLYEELTRSETQAIVRGTIGSARKEIGR